MLQGCVVQIGVFFEPDDADFPCHPHRLPQAVVIWSTSNNVDDAICGSWLTDNNWKGVISIPITGVLDSIDDGLVIRTLTVMEIHYSVEEEEEEVIYSEPIGSIDVC